MLIDPNGLCESGFVVTGGTDANGQAWIGCRTATFWEGGPVRRFTAGMLGDAWAGFSALAGDEHPTNPLLGYGYTPGEIQDLKVLSIMGLFPAGRGAEASATVGTGLIQRGAAFFRGGAASAADDVAGLIPAPRMIKHHIFNAFHRRTAASSKYRDFFASHGIDVDRFTVVMPESLHRQWIHRAGNNWTTIWKRWIDANPNATTTEVYQQAGRMMDDFGINARPIVPYRE